MADCRSQFLRDDPTAEDFFGSRKRLAKTLLDIITKTQGGKTIGLVGEWGSGKSSLVKSLEDDLRDFSSDDCIYELIVFDAWAHEGDPLRRVFLERLERHLMDCGWIQDKRVSDALSCRTSLAIKDEGPSLTPRGQVIAAAIFGSAALLGFLAATRTSSLISQSYLLYGAAAAAALPLVAFLGSYLPESFRKRHGTPEDPSDARGDLLRIVLNKPTTTARTQTRSTPDPTSVDFEDHFRCLLGRALHEQTRELVLVVDNLDRIDPEQALSVWSTMRTFFDCQSESKNHSYLERLWLLVPFARQGVEGLFEQGNAKSAHSLDKVFDFLVEVPPPISSQWRDYFLQQLARALPPHAESPDLHTIYRLYQLRSPSDDWPATPRSAKRFVNKLVTVHHTWVHDIPLPTQALFVLLNGQPVDFSNEDELSPAERYLVGPDWRKDLVALYYGLDPELALEAVVGPDMAKALETGDVDALRKMKSLPAFASLFETVVLQGLESWRVSRPLTLFTAAAAAEAAELGEDDHAISAAWHRMAHAAQELTDWTGLTPEVMEGVAVLIGRAIDPVRLADSLVRSVSNARMDDLGPENWYRSMVRLLDCLEDRPTALAAARTAITVPGDSAQYLAVMSLAAIDMDSTLISSLHTSCEREDVLGVLLQYLAEPEIADSTAGAIAALTVAEPGWDYDSLVESIVARLRAPSPPLTSTTVSSLRAIARALHAAATETVTQSLREAAIDSTLSSRWWEAYSRGEHDVADALISLLFDAVADGIQASAIGHAGNTATVLNRLFEGEETELRRALVADASRSGSRWLLPFLVSDDVQLSTFGKGVLGDTLAVDDSQLAFFGGDAVLNHYGRIAAAAPDRAVVAKYVLRSVGATRLMSDGFMLDRTAVYRDVMKAGLADEDFRSFVVTGLQAYDSSVWRNAIAKNSPSVDILGLLASDDDVKFGKPLADAIGDLALSETPPTFNVVQRLQAAVLMLEEEQGQILRRRLAERMESLSGAELRQFRYSWGSELLSDDFFSATATRFITQVAMSLVREGATEDVGWVAAVFNKFPSVAQSASRRSRQELRSSVKWRRRLRRTSQSVNEQLGRILDCVPAG